MVRLVPVRAFYPDPEIVNVSEVVSPVYDIMGEEELARYDAKAHNAANFTSRPHAQTVTAFVGGARKKLQDALDAGAYRQDGHPELYVYGIRYVPPADILETIPAKARKKEYLLLGVVGGLDLSDGGEAAVAKHERTFPDRVDERVRLTDATGMHFAPIMASYSLPNHAVNNLVEDTLGLDRRALSLDGSVAPLVEGTVEGATHRLWRIEDPEVARKVQELLAPVRLLILDGHHRYTASLDRRQRGVPDLPLVMLVEAHDRALLLLPWHRVVRSRELEGEGLERRIRQRFRRWEAKSGTFTVGDVLAKLQEVRSTGHRGFVGLTDGCMVTVLGQSSTNEGTDYEMLRELLEEDLQIPPDETEFLRSPRRAFERIRGERPHGGRCAFFIPQLSVEGVERTAFDLRAVMAQKSTMFLPKVAEGVIFAPADREPPTDATKGS